MLVRLYVENLAIVKEAIINFNCGMNLFTGETGAGKSILINAINSIIGGRCSKDMVRFGEKRATIVAYFENLSDTVVDNIKTYFKDFSGHSLTIKREIYADGKTNAKINDMVVNISILKKIGSFLINMCGQHSSQSLLNSENHLAILDEYFNLENLLSEYRNSFLKLVNINKKIKKIMSDQSENSKKIDDINFQINEIEEANLKKDEDREVENCLKSIKNSAKILENLNLAHGFISGNDDGMPGALSLLAKAAKSLKIASSCFNKLDVFSIKLEELLIELKELDYDITGKLSNLDFSMEKLQELESRFSLINRIKRSYGPSISDVFEKLNRLKSDLKNLNIYESDITKLVNLQKAEIAKFKKISAELSNERNIAAKKFSEAMLQEFSFLDMNEARFETNVCPSKASINGLENVEFLVSFNVGEPLKSIGKIASGGELSRIMLSIKNVLAKNGKVKTLVFDEIDIGVSGFAAKKIGLKLKQSAENCQIICVTHTAQIAAFADEHFKISKSVIDGRAFVKINSLNRKERIDEIARIIAADSVTDLTLKMAEEMLDNGKTNKQVQ